LIHLKPEKQLETDPNLLIPKAQAALERYGHQVVIANDLNRRKYEVAFVSRKTASDLPAKFEHSWLRIDTTVDPKKEIEEDIIEELVKRHIDYLY
jgi:phosphopantothenate-cysteine ligase